MNSLSVIIPTYNEVQVVERVFRSWHAVISAYIKDFEIIAVDGSSSDGTLEILRELEKKLPGVKVVIQPKNARGHGRALLLGYREACKEWVFQTDSDEQFDPADFVRLAALADKNDFITGIRSNRSDPKPRLVLTKIIRSLMRPFCGASIRDANCPFRLMKTSLLRELLKDVPDNFLAPNIALSILAKTGGARFADTPVTHRMRAGKQDGRQRFLGIAVKGFFQLLWLKPVRERLFVFLAVVLPVLIQQIPNLLGTPGRDVGGYAYGGWRISHGEVLYRDVWDHKPPLLYFVYAGLFRIFSPEMRWAALFELAWLVGASALMFSFLRRYFRYAAALAGTLLFSFYFATPQVAESFGMTEVYSAAMALAALYCALTYGGRLKNIFCAGMLVSAAFLFRQTGLFVLPSVLLAVFLYRKDNGGKKPLGADLLALSAGAVIPVAFFAAYFAAHGALGDAVDQIFLYNFAYSAGAARGFINGFINAAYHMVFVSPLHDWPLFAALALAGIVFAFLRPVSARRNAVFCTALWLLFALKAVALSGRFYGHYYLELFVPMAFFACFAMEALLELKTAAASVLIVSLMVCATPFLTSAVSAGMYMSGRYESPSSPSDKRLMAHWLGDNTSPDDYVYFWGAESGINFTSLRRSPSKIHYIYPLITPGCDNSEDAARLIGDLKRNPPKFIIDCSIVNPAVPPLGFNFAGQPQAGADGYLWHGAAPAAGYILSKYALYARLGSWIIYRRRPEQIPS